MSTFLVTGATGNVGGATASRLLDAGHHVRGLTRDASTGRDRLPDGVEVVEGDLAAPASLVRATTDVDGIFFMQHRPVPEQAQNMAAAAAETGVDRMVVLSSIGTRLDPQPVIGSMIDARDQILRSCDLDLTFLHPNAFFTNTLWWRDTIRAEGRVYDASMPGKTVPIDTGDIATVAAMTLTEDGHVGHDYVLNGPEGLSARDQVEVIAAATGRDLEFVDLTPEELAEREIAHGTPEQMARAVQDLNENFRLGRASTITHEYANLTGREPRTFHDWATEHAPAFS